MSYVDIQHHLMLREYWAKCYNKEYRHRLPKDIFMDFQIVSHCNHSCICCSHFAPYAIPYSISTRSFQEDLKQAIKFFNGRLRAINLTGGEPLLHEDIEEIICIAHNICEKESISIQLSSNAELVPTKGESFIRLLAKKHIIFHCSVYPFNTDAISLCKRYMYKYRGLMSIANNSLVPNGWSTMTINNTRTLTDDFSCNVVCSVTLYKEKLCTCHIPLYISNLDSNYITYKEDYINIYGQSLNDFEGLLKKGSLKFCTHCSDPALTNWCEANSKEEYIKGWTQCN